MVVLYHNPRCSKSCAALALLEERGVAFELVRYLETPLDENEIGELLHLLGMKPLELMRTGETVFKELALGEDDATDRARIEAMAANPILMERPVFLRDGRAVVGRPPERVLELIE